jgi:O-methyltransferase domain/Dimerisation domain
MDDRGWSRQQLLELSDNYWQTCALHAGVELDLFTPLAAGPLTPAALARMSGCEPRALGMLLEALAAMKLLEQHPGGYAATPAAARWLNRSSPDYQGYIIRHHHHLMDSWANLSEAVRSGRPVRGRSAAGDEEWREAFLMGMFNIASARAGQLAPQLDLTGRSRLLDLGGGPGTYACHFCRAYPELTATVFDLPTSRQFAERTIADFGLAERVAFAAGNFLTDPLPGRYDVAWLSQILHGEGPQGCERILGVAVAALEPGGSILVQEFMLDDQQPGPLFPALFSLNMLLGTEQGQAYREGELRDLMGRAGVREIRRLQLDLPGPAGILVGTV